MNTADCQPGFQATAMCPFTANDSIPDHVRALIASPHAKARVPEQRKDHRYPYPYLIRLTPVDQDSMTPVGSGLVVVGKHLSEHGLGFYHTEPLPHRRAIVTFDAFDAPKVHLLIDLRWCRFTGQRWYESGGRFLQVIESPLDLAD